jgi:response regulator RpfG family c-di-GMP phosphodiesterase
LLPHPGQERILLVDDQPAILDAAAMALTRGGYQVRTTTSPEQAIDLALHEPIDVLVTDFLMPTMSGLELLRVLRGVYPDLAAVLITGHGTLELTIDALRAGATGFLRKPFAAAELRAVVDEALAKSRVLKENQRLKALLPLYETSRLFYEELSLDRLTPRIAERLAREVEAEQVRVLLIDPDAEPHTFRSNAIFPPGGPDRPLSASVLDWVATTRESFTVREGADTGPAPPDGYVPSPGPVIYLPLLANDVLVGLLRVKKAGPDVDFTDNERELLRIQASQAAVAIRNALLLRQVEEGYLHALAALANALEAKDTGSRAHTERLAEHTVLVARALGLEEREVAVARMGALVHDVGKIGVPDQILRKTGQLTIEEYAVVREHPTTGDRILAPFPSAQPAREVVRWHHERYDGTGYPTGLSGTEIPLAARIVAVVDAFDAVTQPGVYRAGESSARAMEELLDGRGSQFDPDVVDAFREVRWNGEPPAVPQQPPVPA